MVEHVLSSLGREGLRQAWQQLTLSHRAGHHCAAAHGTISLGTRGQSLTYNLHIVKFLQLLYTRPSSLGQAVS